MIFIFKFQLVSIDGYFRWHGYNHLQFLQADHQRNRLRWLNKRLPLPPKMASAWVMSGC